MKQLQITFIGAGNMTEALVAGLLGHGHDANTITMTDINTVRLQAMLEKFNILTSDDSQTSISNADVVVLAVKPQQMKQVLNSLGTLPSGITLISIAAGQSTTTMKQELTAQDVALVRVMPNTPALLGVGMSVLFSDCNEEHKQRASYIFAASGETAWVEKESMLNAVTAISGSGPAYFFLLAEIMQATGESMGLSAELAGKLAAQTALGAGHMLKDSGRSAETLRHQVSSPGGTTQAALDCMFEKGLPAALRSGIRAAEKRSKELS